MARVYGQTMDELGNLTWVTVTTDANGYNDEVNLVWLAQVLQLNTGESPFYSDWGIPAEQSVLTGVYPDYHVMRTQQRFSTYFPSVIITRLPPVAPIPPPIAAPGPTYRVNVLSNTGAILPPITIPTSIPT
jgi:hypothetical protein